MSDIVIIDYGIGNLRSLERSFKRAGCISTVSSDPDVISNASRLLLPGVGHFEACMSSFNASGLRDVVEQSVNSSVPILGVCVGMQMMFEKSEEGNAPGLSWFKGEITKFPVSYNDQKLNVPHVGMSVVETRNSILFEGIDENPRFYFTHSYRNVDALPSTVIGTTSYGGTFTAAINKGHIFGTQFHPEKSHSGGISLLKNFVRNT